MSVTTTAPPQKARTTAQNIGLILSFIVLGGILSSKCYHDYSAYGLTIRVLTESRSAC